MDKPYKKPFVCDKSDRPVPEIPKSISFSKNNPFSTSETQPTLSENIDEEDFAHLASRLNDTIMQKRKNYYFNQKILDFNKNRKISPFGFLSEESRNSYFSQEMIPRKANYKLSKISYLSERTEVSHLRTQSEYRSNDKLLLINDTLDFLKKMQNFDFFEEEFLLGEKKEFERDEVYFNYLDGVVREEARKGEFAAKKLSFSSTKTPSLTKKSNFYNA